MRRIGALAAVALVATACSGNHSRTLGSYGVTLKLPQGWYGAAAPGQLQVADFPLPRGALASAERAGTSRGHTHLIVWDAGPAVPFLARNHPRLRGPLALRAADLTGPFEGFRSTTSSRGAPSPPAASCSTSSSILARSRPAAPGSAR